MADGFGAKKICCGMSKTLHLPLKAQWYEMIDSGVKREEYREIKAYWVQRLCVWSDGRKISKSDAEFLASNISYLISALYEGRIEFIDCTYVKFSFGYTKRTMIYKIKSIVLGHGNPEWGAPDKVVFIIKLEKRI